MKKKLLFVFALALYSTLPMAQNAAAKSLRALEGGRAGHGGVVQACFKTMSIKNDVEKMLLENLGRPTYAQKDPFTLIPGALEDIKDIDLYDLIAPSPLGNELFETRETDYLKIISEVEKTEEDFDINYSPLRLVTSKKWRSDHYEGSYEAGFGTKRVLPLSQFNFVNRGVVALGDPAIAVFQPSDCLILQIANQQQISYRSAIVNIDQRLFDLLNKKSPVQAAALYHHEWLLRLTIDLLAYQKNLPQHLQLILGVENPAVVAQRLTRLYYSKNTASWVDSRNIHWRTYESLGFSNQFFSLRAEK